MQTIDEALEKLEKSEFRSKFCLDEKKKSMCVKWHGKKYEVMRKNLSERGYRLP